MSDSIQQGETWPGFEKLKHLVIFGDSYSQVGYNSQEPRPSANNPLGVAFPGITWNEPNQPNWIGHLIKKHAPAPLLVFDYARGGDNVSGVRWQVRREFLQYLAPKPRWARWSEYDTLFITWVGINDCAFANAETVPKFVAELFDLQDELYNAGARNFLLVDLPPIHRSPAGNKPKSLQLPSRQPSCELWNIYLKEGAAQFASSHPLSTVLIYSSWETFSKAMDNPTAFGFETEDVRKAGGGMWVDRLHPTSKMHDLVARDLAQFLQDVMAHPAAVAATAGSSNAGSAAAAA
ncbi:carbohydrate esterase family 16 protein [Wolfiporia cocos MD-104 SS10]|uniref:Carbohydrate esterase family 16 protein n=1 Tax=Wolfiporia cocos (strain MD-104) TaxID=742152 RepID=A0A2H3JJP6_WOLCO|nr:carbohydrate esterase family 16 protein [Wolfiporia cocos MD-104 SS10]